MIKTSIFGLLLGFVMASTAFAQGFSGAYLAAQAANLANDYDQAALYYRRALVNDPENGFIMQGAMVASVAAGDFPNAVLVAQKLVDAGFTDEYAQTVLIAQAFADGQYDRVNELLAQPEFDINPLVRILVQGWVFVAQDELATASAHFTAVSESAAINSFGNFHNALALALSGNYSAAERILAADGAYVNRGSILAHVQLLAILGRPDEALAIMISGAGSALRDREADELRRALSDGDKISFTVIREPADAVSRIFLVLADALTGDNSPRLSLFFARLAQLNMPENAEVLLLIGEVLTNQNQHRLAIEAYELVEKNDPFSVNAAIGLAGALQREGQIENAIEVLQNLAAEEAEDITAWRSLGDVLRRDKQFILARDAYTKAIDLLPDPNLPAAWRLYYTRGITSERLQDWTDADWNFRQALSLNPDQPNVLNYLGYSLVERGEKLDEALAMIETAVAARPQSGFIADSLGWIYYRLGRFAEAVPVMENAVALLPVDPTVNDHLGDVLWMVGREREAKFQWRRALSFDPLEVDAERIRQKLKDGLNAVLEAESGATNE